MKEYDFGDFRVEIDEEVTRTYYADSIEWDCTCGHCRNFVEIAKRRELPEEILTLLDKLSVSPEKATYVCELYDEDGKLFYEVSYRLAGKVIDLPPPQQVPVFRRGLKGILDRVCAALGRPVRTMTMQTGKSGTLGDCNISCGHQIAPGTADDFPEPNFDLTLLFLATLGFGQAFRRLRKE